MNVKEATVYKASTAEGTKFSIVRVDVDPEMAVAMLTHNQNNRPRKNNQIQMWIDDMKNGRWVFPSLDLIGFAADHERFPDSLGKQGYGTLLNGQNRLSAIYRSGTTQRLLIMKGTPFTAQQICDLGAKRTLGDRLALANVPNASKVASLVPRAWETDCGHLPTAKIATKTSTIVLENYFHAIAPLGSRENGWVDHPIVLTYRKAAGFYGRQGNLRLIPPAVWGWAWWRISKIEDPDGSLIEAMESFFDQVATGADLAKTSPALSLRHRLGTPVGKAQGQVGKFGMFINAWNAFRANEPAGNLLKLEPFPEPI